MMKLISNDRFRGGLCDGKRCYVNSAQQFEKSIYQVGDVPTEELQIIINFINGRCDYMISPEDRNYYDDNLWINIYDNNTVVIRHIISDIFDNKLHIDFTLVEMQLKEIYYHGNFRLRIICLKFVDKDIGIYSFNFRDQLNCEDPVLIIDFEDNDIKYEYDSYWEGGDDFVCKCGYEEPEYSFVTRNKCECDPPNDDMYFEEKVEFKGGAKFIMAAPTKSARKI